MKKKTYLGVSLDNEIVALIEEQNKTTLVSKSIIVNEILKLWFSTEVNLMDIKEGKDGQII